MPVVAVVKGGRATVNSGSSTAYRGIRTGSLMAAFRWVAESVITAATVVSEPAPAVVGMATKVGIGRQIFSKPCNWDTAFPGRTALAAMPLAQSIREPPPRATMALQPLSRYTR